MISGIGKEKAALLVVIGVKKDGSKSYLALEPGYRESKESWGAVKTVVENWERPTTMIFPVRTGSTYGHLTWWNRPFRG